MRILYTHMYNHALEIIYSDDDEYRDCIRRVFSMNPANCTDDDGFEPVGEPCHGQARARRTYPHRSRSA